MTEVPSIQDFRATVNGIPKKRDRLLVQSIYLTASRVNELLVKVMPSSQNKTQPYGKYMKWKLGSWDNSDNLIIKIAVLKRKVRGKKRLQRGDKIFKEIALPLDKRYEPWTVELLKWIQKRGGLLFNLTDRAVLFIVKKSFGKSYPYMTTHSLRHFRITHLRKFYKFDPIELCVYAGWTFKAGIKASGQLDVYAHLDWEEYYPKLLKELPQ